jgi:hypothetical protein
VGGKDGLKWIGQDVADLWGTVNKEATNVAGWGEWYPELNQVWFGICYGAAQNDPNLVLVLDVSELVPGENGDLRGGWTVYDGDIASARSCCVFSNTLAATRSRTRVPYLGHSGSKLLRYNPTATQDDTTNFQAYVTSGARTIEPYATELERAYLVASAVSGATIRQSLIRNFTDETSRTSDVVLTGTGAQTNVMKKFEDAALQEAFAFQVQLGDPTAVNVAAWHLNQWHGQIKTGAPL